MSGEPSKSERERTRRRWIGFGEVVGVLAVGISALGLWKNWDSEDKPTTIVEQRQAIPLTLLGKVEDDGRRIEIAPVEDSHALESLTVTIKGASAIEVASDGRLDADSVERALTKPDKDAKGLQSLPVRIAAKYVEAGAAKTASASYTLTYRWEGGGFFGGHSLRLVGLRRG